MTANIHELRSRPPETEKITINLGYVDLGHVDLMVQEGFYSNRTDFIRTAIRNQLERHADVVKQSTARKSLELGLRNYSLEDLEAARRAGEMLHINVRREATLTSSSSPAAIRAAASLSRDASRLHPVAGRFRRRYENELHRRRTNVLRGLSCTAHRCQPGKMLELVSHCRPTTRRRRALAYRGHHLPGHARLFG